MMQPPFEMPESLRDLTEKSVEQTRQAFEAFWKASRAAVGSKDVPRLIQQIQRLVIPPQDEVGEGHVLFGPRGFDGLA